MARGKIDRRREPIWMRPYPKGVLPSATELAKLVDPKEVATLFTELTRRRSPGETAEMVRQRAQAARDNLIRLFRSVGLEPPRLPLVKWPRTRR